MIKKFNDFIKYMKVDRIDAAVWMVAFLSTVFIDVTFGLIISVIGQLLSIVLRTQFDGVTARRMHVAQFDEEEDEEDVFNENSTSPDVSAAPKAITFPVKTRGFSIVEQPKKIKPRFSMKAANTYIQESIMIVSWNAPLHYLNREAFRYGVIKKTGGLNPRQLDEQVGEDNKTLETSNMSDPETLETSASVNEIVLDVKSVGSGKVLILELNVPFSDFTGVQELAEMVRDYRKGGVKVYLANVSPGLKLSIENLVKNNLVKAFCDSDDGETQLTTFKTEFLCENVQAAVNRARK
jgi:MFS superfamily sulfate permease-like transporter